MNNGRTYGFLLAVLFVCTLVLQSQAKEARIWATVQFNKRSVVVGEPLLVTITVYTSTWFTGSPQYGEIQVPQALMVDYQQRTGALRKTIGNKSYPAIEKKYVVYPLKEGEHSLPSLSITVESPDEGDYKGRRRTIKSPERNFSVLAPPEGLPGENWLAAYQVRLSEQWNRPPENLVQGDVLERRISIQASGALAALIPPLGIPEGRFGNIYSKAAQLTNVQNENSFTGTRTETWTYLLESEGSFTLPGINISWYNPRTRKPESTEIPPREIRIAENPDLDFLLSMQDSLQAMLAAAEEAGEKVSFEWLGLNWWQLSVVLGSLVAVSYLFIRMLRYLTVRIRKRRERAIDSEAYYFRKLQDAGQAGNPESVMSALMLWYDRFREDRMGPDFTELACRTTDPELPTRYHQLVHILYGKESRENWSGGPLVLSLSLLRKQLSVPGAFPSAKSPLGSLNPEIGKKPACANRSTDE